MGRAGAELLRRLAEAQGHFQFADAEDVRCGGGGPEAVPPPLLRPCSSGPGSPDEMRPGGPRTPPLHAALHLTGLIYLLNMETTSSPPRPRAALRPVRLTLTVRPGGAGPRLHYSSG
ncbi:unnamed protein product [Pleuronectes platessa]|uniref:Uncharacterized protein n=1 Tax=Pleuronectes platessa TaxID=8262 RepID=A0A9N7W2L6_PLEPL|nr:unnamed protein product [Pleuronectes platessa]